MNQTAKIRFDGRYDWMQGDSRSYTILNHIVIQGRDLFHCTFTGAANLLNVLHGGI